MPESHRALDCPFEERISRMAVGVGKIEQACTSMSTDIADMKSELRRHNGNFLKLQEEFADRGMARETELRFRQILAVVGTLMLVSSSAVGVLTARMLGALGG